MRAEDVVRYARWLSELMRGKVEVQSRARRSYRAVVIPTDALLTFGMLKLTSLILAVIDPASQLLVLSSGRTRDRLWLTTALRAIYKQAPALCCLLKHSRVYIFACRVEDLLLFDVESRLRGWCLMMAGQERRQLQRSLIYTIYVEGIAEWQTEIEGVASGLMTLR